MLSQSLSQQGQEFLDGERNAFDQTHHHSQIRHDRRARQTRLVDHHAIQPQRGRCIARISGWQRLPCVLGMRRPFDGGRPIATAIVRLPLRLSGGGLIEGPASPV